jgi:hypothetical protein
MQRRGFAFGVALALAAAGPGYAQEATPTPTATPTATVTPPADADDRAPDAIVDYSMRRTWREGAPRWFASSTIDLGYLYLRPRGSVGYGKPFNTWIGLDANPILVRTGLGAYGGLRFALPFVDLRVGARYFSAFEHAFLAPQPMYTRLDLDRTGRPRAYYLTLEAELSAQVPLGPGEILAVASVSSVEYVPAGSYVFEETLRVMVAPPYVWRARGGYAFKLGEHGQYSIGVVADVLGVPRRDDAITVRTGPVLRFALSRHLEVRGSFVATVASPDRLGLVGGDFTELGLRYRVATE